MSWSYSKLLYFEQCKLRYKLKHVDRVPEEKNPAADRGTLMHAHAEDFVMHRTNSLDNSLLKFSDDFIALRERFKEGLVSCEGEWGFDTAWLPTNYKTAWLRMKADAVAYNKAMDHAIVIDYKSGKRFGNEVKHGEQVQLYALAAMIREPRLQNITVELWYLDKDELTTVNYTRARALALIKPFDKRAARIDKAHKTGVFEPNPNVFTCQWCPYGPNKGKQCPHGMTSAFMSISDYRKKYA